MAISKNAPIGQRDAVAGAIRLGLIGSPESLVGSITSKKANHCAQYYTLEFLNGLASDRFEAPGRRPYCDSYAEAIDIALAALPRRTIAWSFLPRSSTARLTLFSRRRFI
jgi:hypothetical protein